jgi:hypothetical protein
MPALLPFAALLLAVAPTQAETDAPLPVDLVVGTQSIGPKYHFGGGDALTDSARAILEMGSDTLKISLTKDFARVYDGLAPDPGLVALRDVAAKQASYREVLGMPFRSYLLWAYTSAGWWADGLSAEESEAEYREMRELTEYLLTTYSGTGKRFYLGHWEGDWHLHPGYDPSKDPAPEAVQGMIDWLNVRQRAVEDAKRETPHAGVEVYHYTEANLVRKGIAGRHCLTSDVLPRTNVDYVSYSSYDSLGGTDDGLAGRLTSALDYIESKLPPKPGIEGRRVFIGEYGFPAVSNTPERQRDLSREVMRAGLTWGCPFVLYWEMFCNEKSEGVHRGFWLIDDKGAKQPVYNLHARFLSRAREWVAEFARGEGRPPTQAEYQAAAPAWLEE